MPKGSRWNPTAKLIRQQWKLHYLVRSCWPVIYLHYLKAALGSKREQREPRVIGFAGSVISRGPPLLAVKTYQDPGLLEETLRVPRRSPLLVVTGRDCVSWVPSLSLQTATPQYVLKNHLRLEAIPQASQNEASAWDRFGLKHLLVLQLFLSTGCQSWKRPGDKVENWDRIRALWRDRRVSDRNVIKILLFFPLSEQPVQSCCNFPFFFFQGVWAGFCELCFSCSHK